MKKFLFKLRNFINTIKCKSILTPENGWYSEKEFSELLKREQKRTYRTHSPLTQVIIDISKIDKKEINHKNNINRCLLENIIQVLDKNSRELDTKCFVNRIYFKILLVDTTLIGAKKFIEKITEIFYEIIELNNNKKYMNLLHNLKFVAEPLNHFSSSDDGEMKPIILESQTIMNNLKKKSDTSFVNSYNYQKQHSKPLISDTLTFPTPYYLKDTYSDFSNLLFKFFKRLIDIIVSTLGIILFLPVFIIISILIKFTSHGPILFSQKRLGYLGKEFSFLKFRTMENDSDDDIHRNYVKKLINGHSEGINKGTEDEPLYKLDDDPRITKIGRYLRKYSLDELPQFLNVLMGNMSIVGPRPPIPYEVEDYKYWHIRRVLEVKPGITGLWQVNGRSKTTFNEMVRLDIQYINNQSFWMDMKIIIKTFAAILDTDGAL